MSTNDHVKESGVTANSAVLSSSPCVPPPMPWFGIDIGGTLTKLVYFEPTDSPPPGSDKRCREERKILANIRHYLTKNQAYGESGHRDVHLQMDKVTIDGRVGRERERSGERVRPAGTDISRLL